MGPTWLITHQGQQCCLKLFPAPAAPPQLLWDPSPFPFAPQEFPFPSFQRCRRLQMLVGNKHSILDFPSKIPHTCGSCGHRNPHLAPLGFQNWQGEVWATSSSTFWSSLCIRHKEIQRIMEWFVKKTFLSPQRFWRICGSGSGCLIKESRNISLAHLHGKLLEQRLIIKPRRLSLFPAPPGGHWELLDCQIKPGFLKLRAEHVQERGKYSFFKTLYFLQQGWQSCVFPLRKRWNAGSLTQSMELLPCAAATLVWDHYLANDINEFVQPAAAVQLHHHSVLWEKMLKA